jgi:hypothetical protein
MVTVSVYDSETQAKEATVEPLGMAVFMTVDFDKGSAAQSWKDGMATGSNTMMDTMFESFKGILGNMGAGR